MNAYTGYQYISQSPVNASAERRFDSSPAASTRLQRVVANRPPRRGGKPPSAMEGPLQLADEGRRRPRPHRDIKRQCPTEECPASGRQIVEPAVFRHLLHGERGDK